MAINEKEYIVHVEYTMYGTMKVKAETLDDAYSKVYCMDLEPEDLHKLNCNNTDLIIDKAKTYYDKDNAQHLLKGE